MRRILYWTFAGVASVAAAGYYFAGPGSNLQRWAVILAGLGACSVLGWLGQRTVDERRAGPELELRVVAAAGHAGVHVRKVVVTRVREGRPVQYVALRGRPSARTVALGRPMVELLAPREVAALTLHEIAHVRLGHRRLAPLLTVLPLVIVLAEGVRARATDLDSDALLGLHAGLVGIAAVVQWWAILHLRRRAASWEEAADDTAGRYGVRADLVAAYDALSAVAFDREREVPSVNRHPNVYARMRRLQGQASETRSA